MLPSFLSHLYLPPNLVPNLRWKLSFWRPSKKLLRWLNKYSSMTFTFLAFITIHVSLSLEKILAKSKKLSWGRLVDLTQNGPSIFTPDLHSLRPDYTTFSMFRSIPHAKPAWGANGRVQHAQYYRVDSFCLNIHLVRVLLYTDTSNEENCVMLTIVEHGRPKYTLGFRNKLLMLPKRV